MESQTIRIKTPTTVSCSVRFQVFSCDSCFAGKNSGLFLIEIKVSSRFHRVYLLDSTIATCFRRIQANFDRFYSNFRPQVPPPCSQSRVVSSCTGTQRNETLTNCVTTPCMDMKTIGIPPCTGTPGQPPKQPCIHYLCRKISLAKLDLGLKGCHGR